MKTLFTILTSLATLTGSAFAAVAAGDIARYTDSAFNNNVSTVLAASNAGGATILTLASYNISSFGSTNSITINFDLDNFAGSNTAADFYTVDFLGVQPGAALGFNLNPAAIALAIPTITTAPPIVTIIQVGSTFTGSGADVGQSQSITFTGLDQTAGNFALFRFTAVNASSANQFLFANTTISDPSAVPEPSSLALLGLGSLGLVLRRRRSC